jgi:hypothetical protein
MKHHIKIGLIVGAAGFFLNSIISSAVGLCGPPFSLLAGLIAGYLGVRKDGPGEKKEGAKLGAIAGGITGGLNLLGQIVGGIVALAIAQSLNIQLPNGYIPSSTDDLPVQALFYIGGIGASVCFGVIGILLASLAGAGGGYLGTSETPPEYQPSELE